MKIECTGCFKNLPSNSFSININSSTGYCSQCKSCLSVAPFKPHRFPRTLYVTLKSKKTISFKEFTNWLSTTKYEKLYKKWFNSNYDKAKRPSISKVDTDFDWTLNNIRLTKFSKRTKGHKPYTHTRKGLIGAIYNDQKKSSRRRNHPQPKYTQAQLSKWILEHSDFEEIYTTWVNSNYDTMLRPSLDRKKDNKPYSFDNINLTIWRYNHIRGVSDNGVRASKSVSQYKLTGELVKTYKSMSEASRQTGISSGAISNACNKERPNIDRAGGFKWITC